MSSNRECIWTYTTLNLLVLIFNWITFTSLSDLIGSIHKSARVLMVSCLAAFLFLLHIVQFTSLPRKKSAYHWGHTLFLTPHSKKNCSTVIQWLLDHRFDMQSIFRQNNDLLIGIQTADNVPYSLRFLNFSIDICVCLEQPICHHFHDLNEGNLFERLSRSEISCALCNDRSCALIAQINDLHFLKQRMLTTTLTGVTIACWLCEYKTVNDDAEWGYWKFQTCTGSIK